MSDKEPDSNPLHNIGYGRGDDYPRKSQSYSFVSTERNTKSSTEVQPKVEPVENLSVKDLINRLIARNLQAWLAFPENIKNAIMERPQDFQLIPAKNIKPGDFDYDILYNGTIWRYHNTAIVWMIHDIVR